MMKGNSTTPYHHNATSESTFVDHYAEVRKSLHIMSLTIYSMAFLFGVLGNGVVIWVTGFKMKKTVNTVWFLNLAVADFLFTLFLPLGIMYLALNFHWPLGKFMCKLNTTISSLNIYVSVYILMVISVDRCVSVVMPVWAQNHRSVRKASFVSLGVWVIALLLSIPYLVFRDTLPLSKENILCFNNYFPSNHADPQYVINLAHLRAQAMTISRFLLAFIIPFAVIVSSYTLIIHRLRRSHTLASQSTRTFKIIAVVIAAFFLCWAPFHCLTLVDMANNTAENRSTKLDHVITIGIPIATSLAYINSCLNPLLYVFMGQDFKDKVCKSILKALETAFHDDISSSLADTKSFNVSKGRSTDNTEV